MSLLFMNTACDTCGALSYRVDMVTNDRGNFCDEECAKLAKKSLPVFDGWDDGSADLISKQHNRVFSEWERTARKAK